MMATHVGDLTLAQTLVERGARIDAVDTLGRMPIHFALRRAFHDSGVARGELGAVYAHLCATSIELEADGRVISIDARPSDALALAVRGKVEIFATDTVLRSNIPADEETRPLDVQWRAPDARALRDFEVTEETESLPAI